MKCCDVTARRTLRKDEKYTEKCGAKIMTETGKITCKTEVGDNIKMDLIRSKL
jgi:hypothetical protein